MQWKEKAEDDDDVVMIILFVLIYFDCFETFSPRGCDQSGTAAADGIKRQQGVRVRQIRRMMLHAQMLAAY